MHFIVSGKRKAASVLPCTWSPRNISWPVASVYTSSNTTGFTRLCDCQLLPRQYICSLGRSDQKLVFASSGAAGLGPQPESSTGGVWLGKAQKQWLGYGASVSTESNCMERLQTEMVQMKQWAMPRTLSSMGVFWGGCSSQNGVPSKSAIGILTLPPHIVSAFQSL